MEPKKRTVGVIGSGSWATAMVKMLGDNATDKAIHWWVRNSHTADYIRTYKHNPNYLSAATVKIPKRHIHVDVRTVIEHADILILNTPAAFLKDALRGITPEMLKDKIVVSAIKGIVPDENQIVGDYLQEQLDMPIERIVVIGGPCHAEEVSLEKLSYLTVASQNVEAAKVVASLIGTRYIKTNVSDDIYGTEYAAVLKNIYAVAVGMCRGVGFGDNFQAVLVSNALREMAHFVNTVHPINRDIKESVYLGDLLVTSYSQFSRNRTFGNMVGKGYTVKSAQLEMNMVAEGYYAASCIEQICRKHTIELPICRAVYRVLYEQQQPAIEMDILANKLT